MNEKIIINMIEGGEEIFPDKIIKEKNKDVKGGRPTSFKAESGALLYSSLSISAFAGLIYPELSGR